MKTWGGGTSLTRRSDLQPQYKSPLVAKQSSFMQSHLMPLFDHRGRKLPADAPTISPRLKKPPLLSSKKKSLSIVKLMQRLGRKLAIILLGTKAKKKKPVLRILRGNRKVWRQICKDGPCSNQRAASDHSATTKGFSHQSNRRAAPKPKLSPPHSLSSDLATADMTASASFTPMTLVKSEGYANSTFPDKQLTSRESVVQKPSPALPSTSSLHSTSQPSTYSDKLRQLIPDIFKQSEGSTHWDISKLLDKVSDVKVQLLHVPVKPSANRRNGVFDMETPYMQPYGPPQKKLKMHPLVIASLLLGVSMGFFGGIKYYSLFNPASSAGIDVSTVVNVNGSTVSNTCTNTVSATADNVNNDQDTLSSTSSSENTNTNINL